jgi:hypothetical protein
MKANMISRQDTCKIVFPPGAGGETEITPAALESLQIDDDTNCPKPTSMVDADGNNLDMNATDMRFVNIKNSLSPNQASDIRILISPHLISMTTVGGAFSEILLVLERTFNFSSCCSSTLLFTQTMFVMLWME